MGKAINRFRITIASAVILALVLSLTSAPAFASAPKTERVKYLGSGKVEVEFYQDVQYKQAKVTVKDSSGNTYSASIYDRDDDELKFKIKNYKKGKTYKFTISGIRQEYTSKYGKVTGSVKCPKDQGKNITAKQARDIALKDAGLKLSGVYDLEVEKERDDGVVKYEVSFKTKKWEYDYEISLKGAILHREKEANDDYYADYNNYDDTDDDYDDDYGWNDSYNGGYCHDSGHHHDCNGYCGRCPYNNR